MRRLVVASAFLSLMLITYSSLLSVRITKLGDEAIAALKAVNREADQQRRDELYDQAIELIERRNVWIRRRNAVILFGKTKETPVPIRRE